MQYWSRRINLQHIYCSLKKKHIYWKSRWPWKQYIHYPALHDSTVFDGASCRANSNRITLIVFPQIHRTAASQPHRTPAMPATVRDPARGRRKRSPWPARTHRDPTRSRRATLPALHPPALHPPCTWPDLQIPCSAYSLQIRWGSLRHGLSIYGSKISSRQFTMTNGASIHCFDERRRPQ
jgi:hypothetical protein